MLAIYTGCASWLPAPTPMRTLSDRVDPAKPARCLLILLPGRGDSDSDFARHGFIEEIRRRKLSVDTVSANATIGYYAQRTVLPRLETDVLAPARAAGYQKIWVAGISMGGMGALQLARHHASELAGVVLIAPWLGDPTVLDEIDYTGGLGKWQPGELADDDYSRRTWAWLKQATENPASSPALYLLSGDRDRLRHSHQVLEAALPRERVFHVDGKHDWGPWGELWKNFLDRSDFKSQCGEL